MNIYALSVGIILAALIVIRFKVTRLEQTPFAYPLVLASFPLYYFVFAIYSKDFVALYNEFVVGLIFFSLAIAAIKSKMKTAAVLIGISSISHAVYDGFHNMLFINSGTPAWWLEFCGSIDLILGMYMIYFAATTPNKLFKRYRQKAAAF